MQRAGTRSTVKHRATETGDIDLHTPAIDGSGMPLLVFELIAYRPLNAARGAS